MTESDIRREMDFLLKMLGTWHDQINAIAQREENGAIFQYPLHYQNDELNQAKERLIEKSAEVIQRLEGLHAQLVRPLNND
jgi:hypothetical protein